MKKLIVQIPCLNEAQTLPATLADIPRAIAGAFSRLWADRAHARALGDAGYDRARLVTWDGVIEKLVGE